MGRIDAKVESEALSKLVFGHSGGGAQANAAGAVKTKRRKTMSVRAAQSTVMHSDHIMRFPKITVATCRNKSPKR